MLRTAFRGFTSTITLVAALLTLTATSVGASDNNKKPLSVSVSAHSAAPANKAKAADAMSHVPLAFEANNGQADSRVQFLSHGAGYTLFLTRDEAVLTLANGKNQPDVLRVKLAGADAKSKVTALERLGWNTNYFIGKDPKKWRTNVPNYRKVQFDSVYPGVSLVYYGNQRQLEHDFVVAPNADPKQIAMEIAGAKDLSIDASGNLVISTPRGEVRFEKPVVYQDVNGVRKDVTGNFVLRGKKAVGFEIASYDKSKALIIDPVINFGTLLSSSVGVTANALTVDGSGNSYVAGVTQATLFPAPAPAPGTTAPAGPSDDVYVVKVSADGSSLGYVSFIGSSGVDFVNGIALDASGNAYVTGQASCTVPGTSTDFPTTTDAFQQSGTCPGTDVAYLSKLNSTGSALLYSTLLGGDGVTHGIAVGTFGPQAFITGITASSATPLPVSANAFQPALAGSQDAFLAQIDTTYTSDPANLNPLTGWACDGAGNDTLTMTNPHAFVVGEQVTISGVTPTGATLFNQNHAVITAVAANSITYADASCTNAADSGTGGNITGGLVYGSYLGGAAGSSVANAISVSALNSVFVGGVTTSAAFPAVAAAQGAAGGGGSDGFITQFDPTNPVAALSVPASTYVGGSANDQVNALALDGLGNLYAAGFTASTDFPNTAGGAQALHGVDAGGNDAFVTMLPTSLASFTQSSYLGGTGADSARALSISGSAVWVAGQTGTPTADNVFNVNSFSGVFLTGLTDGFVTKFNAGLTAIDVSTYLGGNGDNDSINAIVATSADTIITAGTTDSTDFYTLGGTTGSAFQTISAGGSPAGFALKFSANSTAIAPTWFVPTPPTNATDPLRADGSNSSDYTITLTNNDVTNDAHNVTLDLHSDLSKLLVNSITPTPNTIQCATGQAKASSGVTCDVGTIQVGNSASVVVNVSAVPCAGAPTCPATTAVTNINVGAAEAGSQDTSQSITSNILPLADIQVGAVSAAGDVSGAGKFIVQKDTTFTYAFDVTNIGPNTSGTFDITNTLPTGFTAGTVNISVTTGTATSQTCDAQAGATVTCHVDGLSPAGVVHVSLAGDPTTLLANNVPSTTNQLDFSTGVSITGASYVDPNAGNDTGSNTGSTLERDINLSITTLTATPDVNNTVGHKFIVDQDHTISYVATLHNAGPSDATNVLLTVVLAAGSTVPDPGTCLGAGGFSFNAGTATITCSVGTIAKNASPVQTFTVTPPALATNTASTVLSVNAALSTNPVSANDTGTDTNSVNTTQERDINLLATMTAKPDVNAVANGPFVLQQDSVINYAMTVQNTGPSDGTNVVLMVTFPANSVLSGGQPAACGVGSGYVQVTGAETCVVGNLTVAAGSLPINFALAPPALAANTPSAVLNASAVMTTNPHSASDSGLTHPTVSNTEERVATFTSSAVASALNSDIAEQQVGTVSYTVTGHNNGPSDVPGLRVQIKLDTGAVSNFTALLGNDGAAGCSAPVGQIVTCTSTTPIPAGTDYTITFTATAPATINGNAAPATQVFNATNLVTVDTNPAAVFSTIGGAAQVAATNNYSATVERRSDLSVGALTATAGPTALSGSISLDLTAGSSNTNYAIPGATVVYTLLPTAPAVSFASGGAVNGSTTGAACVNSTPAPSATLVYTCTIASLANAGQAIHLVIGTPTTDNVNAGTVSTAAFTSSACISGPVTATSDPGSGCSGNNLTSNGGSDPSSQIQRQADLDITTVPFAAAPGTVSLAGPLTYTYTIKNNGPDPAVNVLSSLTLTSTAVTTPLIVGAPTNAACVRNVNNVDCSVASLASGASVAITVPITPPVLTSMTGLTAAATDTLNGSVAFGAQVSSFDPVAGNNANATNTSTTLQRTSDVNIAGQAFTATSSAASNAGAVTGTTITTNLTGQMSMTFGLTNAGPDTALNSKVTLANVSGAVATPISGITSTAGSTCSLVGANIQCSVNSVPTGPATTITVNFTPLTPTSMTLAGAASPTGSFTTTAALGAQTSYVDGTAGNDTNATTLTTNLQRQSNIQLNFAGASFTVTPSPVDLTGQLTYAYNYKNLGPDPALKLATRISLTAGPITTPSSFITAGSSYDIGAGPVALANAASNGCVVTTNTQYDCEVDGPIPVGVGNGFVLLFTPPLTTNMSNGAATDAIFNNLTSSSVAVVDNNLGDNPSPTQVTTSIQRTADLAVTSAAATPFTSLPAADGASFVVQKDATIHFDYNVKNNGPSDSPATVVTLTFPSGSTLAAQPAACGGASNYNAGTATETCDLGTLTNGTTTALSFNITPPALSANSAFTGLSAQASITGGVIDNTPANNAMTALITQERDVALTIPTMTEQPDVNNAIGHAFVDGVDSTISYSISVANGGPSDATNVVLNFNLPSGSLLSAQPAACGVGSSYNAGSATETCNIGNIANGANMAVVFVVTPPALAPGTATTVLSALASLTTSSAVVSGNSSNAVNVTQERDADLSATITVPATTLDVGPGFDAVSNGNQQVTYTILANNAGPSPATGVTVTDVLPTGFNFTSFTSTLGGVTCAGAGSPVVVTCNFNAAVLASGATNTITITATATAASLNNALATNIVTNSASIASSDLNDPVAGNNSTPAPASVTLHGEADITISSIVATPVIGAPLHVGDDLNYAVTVHNNGPHPTQTGLNFSNVLPAGVTPVSATPGSGSTNCVLGTTTTCTLGGSIASGSNEVETIRVHVPATAVGALTDNATIDTPANPVVDAEDSNLGNNANSNNTTALAAADVAVAEAVAPNPTFSGNPTSFTVTVTNPAPPAYVPGSPVIGGSASTGVTVHNVVTINPSTSVAGGVTGISNNFGAACPATASFAAGTATFDCTGGTIASNASNTVTFTLTPTALGTMSATASITASAVFDPSAANNSANTSDATVNTPTCSGAGCLPISPVDPVTGNNPLTAPQSSTVTFTNVTTQGATTLAVSNQPAACLVNDPATLPTGSTVAGTYNHQPFHGNVVYTGSRTYACGAGAQPLFYDLATTAVTTGGATVCVNYTGTNFHKSDRVRLLNLTAGTDITIPAGFSATTICGQVASLTSAGGTVRLAVMEPSNAVPNLTPATAAVDTSAAARGSAGAALDLAVNSSFDADGPDNCATGNCSDTLTYTWTSSAFIGGTTKFGPTVSAPTNSTGTVQILLTATDPYGVSETRIFNVTVSAAGSGSGSGSSGSGLVTAATVNKGQAASFTTELDNPGAASGQIVIANAAALASSQISCSVSPSTLPAGSVATIVTVLCSTQGQVFGKLTAPKVGSDKDDMPLLAGMMGITGLPLLGMLLMPGKSRRRKLMKMWAAIGLIMLFTMFQAACGGGGSSGFGGAPQLQNAGTATGTYHVVLTPLPGGVTPSLVPDPTGTTTVPAATTFTLTVQ